MSNDLVVTVPADLVTEDPYMEINSVYDENGVLIYEEKIQRYNYWIKDHPVAASCLVDKSKDSYKLMYSANWWSNTWIKHNYKLRERFDSYFC